MRNQNHLPLSRDAITLIAARFKVLGEPLRLHILQQLQTGQLSVTELSRAVDSTQPNVSKHLKILQDASLVRRQQEGNTVFYSIADESVFKLCEVVCGSLRDSFAEKSAVLA